MFSVILVDDEPWVLSGLEEMLCWENYGFRILGSFTDALQAREAIRAQRPDVVITDIRMPRLSGLELLDVLRREGIPSEFVIISAHRDFEAAHTAINQGVFHYLLKPFDITEVETLLSELSGKLLQSQAVFDPADPAGAESPQIQKVLGAAKRYAHCVLCLSDHQERATAPDGTMFTPFLVRSGYDALLISAHTSKGALPTLPERDADVLAGCGYSCIASDFSNLPTLYNEAEQALVCGFRYSDNRTIAGVQLHLCETLAHSPSLSELAARFYLSDSYLSAQFTRHTGCTISGFTQAARIHRAARSLVRTDLSVREIADSVGLSDYNYFSRLFRRHMGASAEAFRQQQAVPPR